MLLASNSVTYSEEDESVEVDPWKRSLKAMLRVDFLGSIFWPQFRRLMVIFVLTIMQELIFLLIALQIPPATLNYSDVSSIFGNVLPMQTFANEKTAFRTDTDSLFNQYNAA